MTDKNNKADEDIEFIPESEAKGIKKHPKPKPAAPAGPSQAAAEKEPERAIPPAPEAGVDEDLKKELAARDARIQELEKEISGLKDEYLRKRAEMENLRKRLEREKNEYFQFALADLLNELLTIQDNLERALGTADRPEGGGDPLRTGVELIYRLFNSLLAKSGVRPVETGDGKFDPNIHHAMITEEAEGINEPRIAEVLQKGYYLNNRLLRPAMVKVFIPKKG